MPLLDRTRLPPGGFPYREPSLNWAVRYPFIAFNLIAAQIQAVRVNNPASGLDPSLEACADALDLYTCTRLRNDPAWCISADAPMANAIATERAVAARCPACGSRKAAK